MNTTTIRVPIHTRELVGQIARQTGTSMQAVVEQAIEEFRRKRLIQEANAAYEALRTDETAWEDFQAELSVWDAALADGLDES